MCTHTKQPQLYMCLVLISKLMLICAEHQERIAVAAQLHRAASRAVCAALSVMTTLPITY